MQWEDKLFREDGHFVLTSLMWKGIKSLTLVSFLRSMGLKQRFVLEIKTVMSTGKAFLCATNGFQGDWIPEEIACSLLSKLNNNPAVWKLVPLSALLYNLAVNIFHPVGTTYMPDVKDAEPFGKHLKVLLDIEKLDAEFHKEMLFIVLSVTKSHLWV